MPYYLHEGNNAVGPFEPGELARRPGFHKDTLVFPVGEVDQAAWKPAQAFPDLMLVLDTLPPPPPSPSATAASPEPPEDVAAPKWDAPQDKLILIVDDDDLFRSSLVMTLRSMNFRIIDATNGLDAGTKLQTQTPDLIVTDLMMPNQGGYEFLRSLQGSSSARIPVFVITGSVINDATITMIREEANVLELFSKPLNMTKFLLAIHRTMNTQPPPRRNSIF
ncbi:MAG: response regulator [Elusimicrobiota bacterium]